MTLRALNLDQYNRKRVTTAIAVLCLFTTLVFWQLLRRSERAHINRLTDLAAQAITADLRADVDSRLNAMVRLAKAAENEGVYRRDWEELSRLFLEHHVGCAAVEWADSSLRIRKVVTLDGGEPGVGFDLSSDPILKDAMRRAVSSGNPVLTAISQGRDGTFWRRGILAVGHPGNMRGFLLVHVNVSQALRDMLADVSGLGYSVSIGEGEKRIYASSGADFALARSWRREQTVDVSGLRLVVSSWPTAALLPQLRSYLPEMALSLGLLLSGFLVISFVLADEARRRSRQAEAVTAQLQEEVAERLEAEQAVKESQARFAGVLEMSPDAIVSVDSHQRITLFNRGAESIFGYTAAEALGKPLDILLPPRFQKIHRQEVVEYGAREPQPRMMAPHARIVRGLRKDGTEFLVEASISKLIFKGETIYTSILRDVTERYRTQEALRRAHEELEMRVSERTAELQHANVSLQAEIGERKQVEDTLRQLSGRLLQLQDEERRRIARELHDSTSQYLAALGLNISIVQESPGLPPEMKHVLEESFSVVEQCSSEIRTMSYLLHPPLLDDLGLASALQWYIDGFMKRSGVTVQLQVAPDLGRLSAECERALFRIVQECLTNVRRHSGAHNASIRLYRKGVEDYLEVSDDGHGMRGGSPTTTGEVVAGLGVGVAGMQERVRQLGGRLEITSGPQGTCVRTMLPKSSQPAAFSAKGPH